MYLLEGCLKVGLNSLFLLLLSFVKLTEKCVDMYICYIYELFVNILFGGRTSNIHKLTSALLAGKWHMDLHLVSQR